MGVFLSGDLFTAFPLFEVMSFTSFVLGDPDGGVSRFEGGGDLSGRGGHRRTGGPDGAVPPVPPAGHLVAGRHGGGRRRGGRTGGCSGLAACWCWWASGQRRGRSRCTSGCPPPTRRPPAPASAVLSGVITKTGIYGVLVLSTTVFLHDKQWGCCWPCWAL